MSSSLDMSLEDIIRNRKNKASSGGRKGSIRGRGSISGLGPGPDRRFAQWGPIRPRPYPMRPAMQVMEPIMFLREGYNEDSGTKLYISNLDYSVSNEDIKVLFSEVGELQRYSIHYDMNGRSKGTAEVVFVHQTDALAAIKRYNNVHLDGKPMNIDLVGMNLFTSAPMPPIAAGNMGKPNGAFRGGQESIGARGWGHGDCGAGSHGFIGGQGQGRRQGQKGEKLTAEELDADLEKYHLKAMQIC